MREKNNAAKLFIMKSILVLFVGVFISPACATEGSDHYKIQTAFIYQFTHFIKWPKETTKEEDSFIISVVGEQGLYNELIELSKSKMVNGKKIEVYLAQDPSRLKKSDVIILTGSNEGHIKEVSKLSREWNALTVSYAEGFASKGIMINFFIENGRLRFEINRAIMENLKFEVSSRLLQLARLVER